MTKLETINGKIHILSILISISPGNEINMMASSLNLALRKDNPSTNPRTTPKNVKTNKILFLNCCLSWFL